MEDITRDPLFLKLAKAQLHQLFQQYVRVDSVIHILQAYDSNILTDADKSKILAENQNKGEVVGASSLLDNATRYKGWFDCFINVLRDKSVKLDHVAEEMEMIKECCKKKILDEKIHHKRRGTRRNEMQSDYDKQFLTLKISKLKAINDTLVQENLHLQNNVSQLTNDKSILANEKKNIEELESLRKADCSRLTEDKIKLQDTANQLLEQIEKLKEENGELCDILTSSRNETESYKKKLLESDKRFEQLSVICESYKKQLLEKDKTVEQLSFVCEELPNHIVDLRKERGILEDEPNSIEESESQKKENCYTLRRRAMYFSTASPQLLSNNNTNCFLKLAGVSTIQDPKKLPET